VNTTSQVLRSIQSLRALAAISVVLMHVPFIARGSFGVDIFFVISGFIIAFVGNDRPAPFMLKRLIRIVPLYWLGTFGIFVMALIAPSYLGSTKPDPINLVRSLFFIPYQKEDGAIQPMMFLGWTLNYEMLFYTVFAFCLFFGRRSAVLICKIFFLIAGAVGVVLRPEVLPFRAWTDPIVVEFVYGLALYQFWSTKKLMRVPVYLSVVSCMALYGLMVWIEGTMPNFELRVLQPAANDALRPLLFGLPAAALVALVLGMEGRIRFPALLVLVGDASYSLYLFHPYVLGALKRIIDAANGAERLVFLGAALGLSVTVALIFYAAIERPSRIFLRNHLLRSQTTR
jgi:exopolysaccharide production protein ExoZ